MTILWEKITFKEEERLEELHKMIAQESDSSRDSKMSGEHFQKILTHANASQTIRIYLDN